MRKDFRTWTTGILSAALILGSVPVNLSAATPLAGVADYTSTALTSASVPTAGVSLAMTQCMQDGENGLVLASAASVAENDAPVVSAEYANLAVAQVNNFVYIRSQASTEGKVRGKLYSDCVGTVLSAKDGWYKIKSGNVTGFVSADYVVVGDEKAAKSAGRRVATVTTQTLKVRSDADANSEVIGLVPEGDDLTVIDEAETGWVGVSVEEGTGYVSSDYVTLSTEYKYAESKEEEEARLKKEQQEKEAAAAASASSKGQAVVNYACQFVGNPYVYGGSSLTKGTDCSGFVMSVYAHFGISLPHSSAALRSVGRGVSYSEMRAGDIVCYSGHVAICIGGNTIVHASNKKDGIKYTSPANYRKILAIRRIF